MDAEYVQLTNFCTFKGNIWQREKMIGMKHFKAFSRVTQLSSTGTCSIVCKLFCYHAIDSGAVPSGDHTIRSQNIFVLLGQLSLTSFMGSINVPVNSMANNLSSTRRVAPTDQRWWYDRPLSTYDPMSVGRTQIDKSQQSLAVQSVLDQKSATLFLSFQFLSCSSGADKHSRNSNLTVTSNYISHKHAHVFWRRC